MLMNVSQNLLNESHPELHKTYIVSSYVLQPF